MKEFFRGWKRKVGVVMLLMALLAMAAWSRSESFCDFYSTEIDRDEMRSRRRFDIRSASGKIWITTVDITSVWGVSVTKWGSRTLGDSTIRRVRANRKRDTDYTIELDLGSLGFHFETGQFLQNPVTRMTTVTIPYWSITIPLTALSVFLLLRTHHQSIQKKIIEPIPNETGATL